jgi:hypothetical protein
MVFPDNWSHFTGMVSLGLISYLQVLNKKNKKLTDIGFYWCFMDCDPDHYREVFFNGFGLLSINVC